MFGSYTNKLAILGVCAIVFWIICWLVLLSKNDKLPHWLSGFAAILAGLLAFVTAIPSALFSAPIIMNMNLVSKEARKEGFDKGMEVEKAAHPGALKLAEQEGYKKGYGAFQNKYEMLCIEYDWLCDGYSFMYKEYEKGTPFDEIKEDLTTPENMKRDI